MSNSKTLAAEKLYEYVKEGKTFQTDKITRVPSSVYSDPEMWEKEIDLIFKKLPLCLAASAELPESGDYKAMEAVGLPILITRGKDGVARAFLNVCSHRGAPLADEGCGNKARFACKYHGWTFSNDGKLMGVADAHKFGEIDKSEHGLTELPCHEKNGLIFAVLTPGENIDFEAFFAGMLDDLADLDFSKWAYLGNRVITGTNWKIAFDGYLEGYHFAQLHPETIHPRTPSNVAHYEAFGPHMRIGFPQVDIVEKLDAEPRETWGDIENTGYDFVRIMFPNVSLFVAPELTQLAQLFPGPTPEENKTVLMFFRPEPPKDDEDAAALEGMIDWLKNVVEQEDYMIGDLVQKGVNSGAHANITLGKNEPGNQFFHEYVNWYLADDPSLEKPKL
ncbi:MAG: aromatic ring-hydroxylating oxygenase subunit alpha [Parvibaculales bacterium]